MHPPCPQIHDTPSSVPFEAQLKEALLGEARSSPSHPSMRQRRDRRTPNLALEQVPLRGSDALIEHIGESKIEVLRITSPIFDAIERRNYEWAMLRAGVSGTCRLYLIAAKHKQNKHKMFRHAVFMHHWMFFSRPYLQLMKIIPPGARYASADAPRPSRNRETRPNSNRPSISPISTSLDRWYGASPAHSVDLVQVI